MIEFSAKGWKNYVKLRKMWITNCATILSSVVRNCVCMYVWMH